MFMNNTHEVIRHIYFLITYKWMILTTITLRSFTKSVRMIRTGHDSVWSKNRTKLNHNNDLKKLNRTVMVQLSEPNR
jgi:hypothetical protein